MEEVVKVAWYKKMWSAFPKWLRVILVIISIITLIWWAIFVTYHLLEYLRIFLNFVSQKEHWWVFIICILIVFIGGCIWTQCCGSWKPFTDIYNWFDENFSAVRKALVDLLS